MKRLFLVLVAMFLFGANVLSQEGTASTNNSPFEGTWGSVFDAGINGAWEPVFHGEIFGLEYRQFQFSGNHWIYIASSGPCFKGTFTFTENEIKLKYTHSMEYSSNTWRGRDRNYGEYIETRLYKFSSGKLFITRNESEPFYEYTIKSTPDSVDSIRRRGTRGNKANNGDSHQ